MQTVIFRIFLTLLFFVLSVHLYSQNDTLKNPFDDNDSIMHHPIVKEMTLSSFHFGYTANIRDKEKKKEADHSNYHAIELGYTYTKSHGGYKIGYNIYGANEVMFNSKKVFTGPKLGANIFVFLATIGNELICYTDFTKTTWIYKPYFAFSLGPLRSSIGYNVVLSKNKFDLNSASFNISIPFCMKEK